MGINNKHHYTNYSDECVRDGVGCDGYIPNHYDAACDCPCHGDHAPVFITEQDVKEWHS